MMRILRLFTIIFCYMHFAMDAFAGLPVVIRVKNNSGTALKGIVVATENLKNHYQTTTDKNGLATFADKCVPFKGLYNKQKASGVKVCAIDSNNDYKKACTIVSGCEMTITMQLTPLPPGKKYPSAEQIRKYAVNRKGQLVTYPVCDPDYKNYPSNVVKHCVNDFFKSTQVQMLSAETLANIYTKQKYNHDIVCSIHYRSKNNDDYLKCTSKDAKHVYEFRFDDLTESIRNRVQKDTVGAVCRLHNGKFDSDSKQIVNYEGRTMDMSLSWCDLHLKDPTNYSNQCKNIDKDTSLFGYNTHYGCGSYRTMSSGNGLSSVYQTCFLQDSHQRSINMCVFDFNDLWESNYTPAKPEMFPNIDPYVFEKIQIKSNRNLITLLHQYVSYKVGDAFKSLRCKSGFHKFHRANSREVDDIIECYLTTVYGKDEYRIDFVFDDVNEVNDTKTDGGTQGMACIAKGGDFDGKNCVGLGKSQCLAISYDKNLGGKTQWDEKLGVCKLESAAAADNLRRFEKGVMIGGTIVAGVLLSVVVPGGGTAMVLALTATGISGIAEVTKEGLIATQNSKIRDFGIASYQCPDSETCNGKTCSYTCNPNSKCSKDLLLNNWKDALNVVNTNDTSLRKSTASAIERSFAKIGTCSDDKFETDLENATSKLGTWITIAEAVENNADLLTLTNPKGALKTMGKTSVKQGIQLTLKNPKALKTLSKYFTGKIKQVTTTTAKKEYLDHLD